MKGRDRNDLMEENQGELLLFFLKLHFEPATMEREYLEFYFLYVNFFLFQQHTKASAFGYTNMHVCVCIYVHAVTIYL